MLPRGDQHHADAAVEDATHLHVGDLTVLLEEAEDGRLAPRARVDPCPDAVGEDARDVALEAAPSDVCDPVQGEVAKQAQDGLHVDPGRGQQGCGQGGVELRRGVAQLELSGGDTLVHELANQGEPVAVDAVGGHSQQDVSFADRGAVDHPVALHHADSESHQLQLVLGIEAGHAGGFPAQQCAARAPAALGDTAQGFGGDRLVQLAHGEVVEEDQGLGSLNDQVVRDHGDAVDAHRVVALEQRGELELGADPVCAGHEDRLLVALGRLEQTGESTDRGEDLGPGGAAPDLLDLIDESLVPVEIHAGTRVGGSARLLALLPLARGAHGPWIGKAESTCQSAPKKRSTASSGFAPARQGASPGVRIRRGFSRPLPFRYSSPGRSRQMQDGAKASDGDVILFLRADTRWPDGFADPVRRAPESLALIAWRLGIDHVAAWHRR